MAVGWSPLGSKSEITSNLPPLGVMSLWTRMDTTVRGGSDIQVPRGECAAPEYVERVGMRQFPATCLTAVLHSKVKEVAT